MRIIQSLCAASTIGFGDFAPTTRLARLFAVVFIPLSVAAAGELLSGVALAPVYRRQKQVYEKQLESDLTMDHLQVMDSDGDGKVRTWFACLRFVVVYTHACQSNHPNTLSNDLFAQITREEYVQFKLIQMGRVGKEELDELFQQFDQEDLKLMAKLRGARVI